MAYSTYTGEWYGSPAARDLAEAEARAEVSRARRGVTVTTERRGDTVITTEVRRDFFGNVVETTVTEETIERRPVRYSPPPRPMTDREAEVVLGTTIAVGGLAILGALMGGKD